MNARALMATAREKPGRAKWRRGGAYPMRKIKTQIHSSAATYSASNPQPTATPANAQSIVESRSTARHVKTIASVQKKTESASMVINVEPTASNGVAHAAAIVKNPARAF